MIIRKYGDIPASYVPDVGEVVDARTSSADDYQRAVILAVTRKNRSYLEFKVRWLATDEVAWVRVAADAWPSSIRQIPKGQASGG